MTLHNPFHLLGLHQFKKPAFVKKANAISNQWLYLFRGRKDAAVKHRRKSTQKKRQSLPLAKQLNDRVHGMGRPELVAVYNTLNPKHPFEFENVVDISELKTETVNRPKGVRVVSEQQLRKAIRTGLIECKDEKKLAQYGKAMSRAAAKLVIESATAAELVAMYNMIVRDRFDPAISIDDLVESDDLASPFQGPSHKKWGRTFGTTPEAIRESLESALSGAKSMEALEVLHDSMVSACASSLLEGASRESLIAMYNASATGSEKLAPGNVVMEADLNSFQPSKWMFHSAPGGWVITEERIRSILKEALESTQQDLHLLYTTLKEAVLAPPSSIPKDPIEADLSDIRLIRGSGRGAPIDYGPVSHLDFEPSL